MKVFVSFIFTIAAALFSIAVWHISADTFAGHLGLQGFVLFIWASMLAFVSGFQ